MKSNSVSLPRCIDATGSVGSTVATREARSAKQSPKLNGLELVVGLVGRQLNDFASGLLMFNNCTEIRSECLNLDGNVRLLVAIGGLDAS